MRYQKHILEAVALCRVPAALLVGEHMQQGQDERALEPQTSAGVCRTCGELPAHAPRTWNSLIAPPTRLPPSASRDQIYARAGNGSDVNMCFF